MGFNHPIRIAVVIPKYGLVGGAESFAYEVTERLAQRNDFEMHVFANRWRHGTESITFHKVPILLFPRWLRPISFAWFARKAVYARNCAIVHSHERIFDMDLFTFHGIPHRTWIREVRGKCLSLFDHATAWVEQKGIQCDGFPIILPVSNLAKNQLLRTYEIPESRVHVIPPGLAGDLYLDCDKEISRNEIRQQHGLAPDDIVVLFVGMNFEIKGLELLLKGVAAVAGRENRKSKLKVLVVGKGNRQRYLSMARDLGIVEQVFFAGVTFEVEKYYLASDIFAMPSRFDTFGLAVLEAMAGGLPAIVTETVGAKDLLDHGLNGFVLPANPLPEDIASILTLLMDNEKRAVMGENAKLAAFAKDWNDTAEQIAELYYALATRK